MAAALLGERQYRALLAKSEHENRYQRLFLMTTGLKTEIYLMHKNSEEIERVMSNAYRLYEQILKLELPGQMQQMGLEIARDVHEIKKDYIRIIQGVEQAIGEEYNEESMSFQDILQILEASTYRLLAGKRLDVRLLFDCRDNFTTREHYTLMAVLKNLVNNAIEAIETKKKSGTIHIIEKREEDRFVFRVLDERTGNIYRGVGLCGVKNAVEEQFKGSICVKSTMGKGAEFRIEIPAAVLEEP